MTLYRVNDVYPCVQGEGCFTGQAMVLVRLQGCAVQCSWCDTKETWHTHVEHCTNLVSDSPVGALTNALGTNERYATLDPRDLAVYIRRNYPSIRWVLLTGGEPAEQELGDLVHAFHVEGLNVALETSGTATGHVGVPLDWVCVSPKVRALPVEADGMPSYFINDLFSVGDTVYRIAQMRYGGPSLNARAFDGADEIKFVIGRDVDLALADAVLTRVRRDSRVSPDVVICLQPLSASPKATQLCIDTVQARGWRLSVQTHKLLSLR